MDIQELKNKIVQHDIVREQDWQNMTQDHINLAKSILDYIENNQEDDQSFNPYESAKFLEEFSEIQDNIELMEIDKVKPSEEKEKEFSVVQMKIPVGYAKFLQEKIFPRMQKENE